MGNLYAFIIAFVERLNGDFQWGEITLSLVTHVPIAVVLAWIASKGSTSVPLDYLFVGVLLMSIWNRVSIRVGWTITGDILGGTYDYIATARTPLAVVVFARAIALTVLGTLSALLPLLAIPVDLRKVNTGVRSRAADFRRWNRSVQRIVRRHCLRSPVPAGAGP